MGLSRSRTKRVCLASPASRASEAMGKFEAIAGFGGSLCAAPAKEAPEHSNAAAHSSAHRSKTPLFARLANEFLPPSGPVTAIERHGKRNLNVLSAIL